MKGLGIVAAGHPQTAAAAEIVLRDGGNAYDAVVAALAAACAAEPVLVSPGGGGFLLADPADQPPRVYDFFVDTPRWRAPLPELDFYAVHADFGTAVQEFHVGRGTVATPGFVRGLFRVHGDLGRMPMRDVLAPAAEIARNGLEITAFQAYLFDVVAPIYRATPQALALYHGAQDPQQLVTTGDCLRNPELADLFEVLAIEGADLFYRGEVARAMVAACQSGGQLADADLAAYEVAVRPPLERRYGDVRVLTNPPPSSGGLLIAFGLALLDGSDIGALAHADPRRLALLARVLDATQEARVALAASTGTERAEPLQLLAPDLIARYRAEIAARPAARRGTTHVSVIDGAGNLASATVSNGEGAGVMVPGAGFMLNNMLGEEDLNPTGFQTWTPATRMTSMMAPTALHWRDGTRVATGSGGSNRIRTALLQVIVNLVDHGMSVEDAVCAPRLHLEKDLLSIEGGFDPSRLGPVLEAFPEHQIWDEQNLFFGGAHTVASGPDGLRGMGDPRRAGRCVVV